MSKRKNNDLVLVTGNFRDNNWTLAVEDRAPALIWVSRANRIINELLPVSSIINKFTLDEILKYTGDKRFYAIGLSKFIGCIVTYHEVDGIYTISEIQNGLPIIKNRSVVEV